MKTKLSLSPLMFVTLLILLAGSLITYVWATSGRFGACVEGTAGDLFRSVVGELDNTVDLTVKLSTTLGDRQRCHRHLRRIGRRVCR